jgi:hypothetical protein
LSSVSMYFSEFIFPVIMHKVLTPW